MHVGIARPPVQIDGAAIYPDETFVSLGDVKCNFDRVDILRPNGEPTAVITCLRNIGPVSGCDIPKDGHVLAVEDGDAAPGDDIVSAGFTKARVIRSGTILDGDPQIGESKGLSQTVAVWNGVRCALDGYARAAIPCRLDVGNQYVREPGAEFERYVRYEPNAELPKAVNIYV